jgi:hypothetical protein
MNMIPFTIIAQQEIERRRASSSTYTEPLPKDSLLVQSFLQDFYSDGIFHRVNDFKADLITYHETVGEHYKYLVPAQVTFEDFFSRYLYRCNAIYLLQEMNSVNTNTVSIETKNSNRANSLLPLLRLPKKNKIHIPSNRQSIIDDIKKIRRVPSSHRVKAKPQRDATAVANHPWRTEHLQRSTTKCQQDSHYGVVSKKFSF